MTPRHPVLYFDGVCNLCNQSVQWVIRRDKKAVFRFAPLQSQAGLSFQHVHFLQKIPDSVLLQYKGKVYVKSGAVLKLMQILGGVYKLSVVGWLVPRFVRDVIYDYIARNRYKWFGKKETCMIPTEAVRKRFLE